MDGKKYDEVEHGAAFDPMVARLTVQLQTSISQIRSKVADVGEWADLLANGPDDPKSINELWEHYITCGAQLQDSTRELAQLIAEGAGSHSSLPRKNIYRPLRLSSRKVSTLSHHAGSSSAGIGPEKIGPKIREHSDDVS